METLSVGMYVRTLNGIVKIDKIKDSIMIDTKGKTHFGDFIKASYNIIDILEVGDYVNGDKIEYIDDCEGAMREFYYDYENPNDDVGHWQEEIKTIITHEQMEQMAYKVS